MDKRFDGRDEPVILASVYVETLAMARADGPDLLRPIGEVEFANGAAAMSASGNYGPCRVAAAIVGHADLRNGDAVAELLDRALAAAPDRFRGIRQLTMEHPGDAPWRFVSNRPAAGILASPGFRPAFRHLAPRGLCFTRRSSTTSCPSSPTSRALTPARPLCSTIWGSPWPWTWTRRGAPRCSRAGARG